MSIATSNVSGVDRSCNRSRSASSDVLVASPKFASGVYDDTLCQCFSPTRNRDINYVRTCAKSNLTPPYAAYTGCPSVKWERNICIANFVCVALHYAFVDLE